MKGRDERVRLNADETRSSRTMEENIAAGDISSQLATQEKGDRPFKDEFQFDALPNPNEGMNGEFHYFWATTTNQQDTPHRRMRMGYQLVRAEERPEFQHLRLKAGEWENCISINEMLLMRIPSDIYQKMMLENHHHRPNDLEASVKANATSGHNDNRGNPLDISLPEDEGFREMGRSRKAPNKFE